jgi:SprT-like family
MTPQLLPQPLLELFTKFAKLEVKLLCPKGWKFVWTDVLWYTGLCDYETKEIRMSFPIARYSLPKYLSETLLHEIAHSLTPGKEVHGKKWKSICKRLGVRPAIYPTNHESRIIDWVSANARREARALATSKSNKRKLRRRNR